MIDSHTHLNMQDDPRGCITRARDAGLQGMLTIGTQQRHDTPQVDPLCLANENFVWRTIGTHPGEVHESDEKAFTAQMMIDQINAAPYIIGVGETGLDPTYAHTNRAEQMESFEKHIEVALATDTPIIMHTRQAEADCLDVVKTYPKLKGIFHCYTGDVATAERILAEAPNFMISISGIVTYPKSTELRDVVKILPADRMLIETDAPYLAPAPHRGKNNEPAYVLHTLELLARERGDSYPELGAQVAANFRALFNV